MCRMPTTRLQAKAFERNGCEYKLCLGDNCECPEPPPDADHSLKQVFCKVCDTSKFVWDYISPSACGDEDGFHDFKGYVLCGVCEEYVKEGTTMTTGGTTYCSKCFCRRLMN